MTADGSIVVEIDMNTSEADKKLKQLQDKIGKMEDAISGEESKRGPLVKELESVTQKAEEASLQIQKMKTELAEAEYNMSPEGTQGFGTPMEQFQQYQEIIATYPAKIKAQEAEYQKLNSQSDALVKKVSAYDEKLKTAQTVLDKMKEEAGGLAQKTAQAGIDSNKMASALERAQKGAARFSLRLREVVRSALVFTLISQSLASFRNWMGKVIKTNAEATASIARLKGALLTLAQPLVNILTPAFISLLNVLSAVISAVAKVISTLFGSTIESSKDAAENLNDEMNAMEGVGGAAKKASKYLASFDEINQSSSDTSEGAGGGLDSIKPDFSAFDSAQFKSKLDEITAYVSGALLALGAILAFSGVNIPLGIALMAAGAIGLVTVIASNWGAMDTELRNAITRVLVILGGAAFVIGAILAFSGANVLLGIGLMIAGAAALGTAVSLNWDYMDQNLRNAITGLLEIVGAALLVIGAIFAFSGANIPLGIGLMMAGALSLAAAAVLNWEEIQNNISGAVTELMLLLGSALLAVGAVLALSGANLPLGIGLMIAGAAALGVAAALNWDAVVDALQGPLGKILALVSGALLVLGAILVFTGAALPLGIGLLIAGAAGLASIAAINWNFIITALQGDIGKITAIVSAALLVLGIILCFTGVGIPLGVALIAAGAGGLVTVTALNWNALLDKLKDTWGDIKNWWNTYVAKFFTLDFWSNLGANILNGLWDGLKSIWGNISGWVSDKVGWITGAFSGAKTKVSGQYTSEQTVTTRALSATSRMPHILTGNIPALAQGAVIPPNREFMAVLGDQTSGNNIEAPETLIRKIVREEAGSDNTTTALLQAILDAVREGKILMVDNRVLARVAVKGINSLTQSAGKSVLLL